MILHRWTMTFAVAALLTTPAIVPAQTATEPTINQRRAIQQDRIANGVKNRQLTAGQTARLEQREAHINREIRADRRAHSGRLTRAERRRITRQQNRTSRAISRAKHDSVRQ